MTYQIFLKGQPVSPAPNTYWASAEMAENTIPIYERNEPSLKGRLEVREAQPIGGKTGS